MLLKSWAMPPLIVPRASIFWAWRNWVSTSPAPAFLLEPVVGLLELCGPFLDPQLQLVTGFAQRLIHLLALGDVREDHGNLTWRSSVRKHFEAAAEFGKPLLKVGRFSRERHFAVTLEPDRLSMRKKLESRPADKLLGLETRLFLICRIEGQVTQITWLAGCVEDDFVERESLAHSLKQCPVTLLTCPERLFGPFTVGQVEVCPDHANDRPPPSRRTEKPRERMST